MDLDAILRFDTYDDYLDSLVTAADLHYLSDQAIARQLIEHGGKTQGRSVISREQFEKLKEDRHAALVAASAPPIRILASSGLDLSGFPFLQALAEREDLIKSEKLVSILFLLDRNARGETISGYIDLGERLATDDFLAYFMRRRKLLPRSNDLSFHNWTMGQTSVKSRSMNFETEARGESGIIFHCIHDGAIIFVDPTTEPVGQAKTTLRHDLETPEYEVAVIFDHML